MCMVNVLRCMCDVLGHLAPVHRYARSLCYVACAVSWATWLLFTTAHARCVMLRVRCVLGHLAPVHRCARLASCAACAVTLSTWLLFTVRYARCVVWRVRCPGPLGSCSSVCTLGALCWVCCVLGHLSPVHGCVRSACCAACTLFWATWLPFTSVHLGVLCCVRCPGPLGCCSPVCKLGVLCCVCDVLGHLAPVPRCVKQRTSSRKKN